MDIPEPNSRFVELECESCNSASVVFTIAKSSINCRFCGNLLAKPTGGKSVLYGKVKSILDSHLSKISVKSVQKDGGKQTKILLDTMIIHNLINGKSIPELANASPDSTTLIVLDRILIETEHMEKQEYDVTITGDKVIQKLEEIGKVEKIYLDHASSDMIRAKDLAESKKYVNDRGVPLSESDCILLQMALSLEDAKLVTLDKTLNTALKKEKDLASMYD